MAMGEGEKSAEKSGPAEPRLIVDYREPVTLSPGVQAALWSVIFSLILGVLFWRARIELGWGQKKKDLQRMLKARLKRVEARAHAGDWRGVGAEMTNTVYFVLGAITGEGGAHLELDKLMMKAPPSVRRELAGPVAKQMEIFQILTFAPESVVGGLKDPAQLKQAISEMESLLSKAVSLGLSSEQSDGIRSKSRNIFSGSMKIRTFESSELTQRTGSTSIL